MRKNHSSLLKGKKADKENEDDFLDLTNNIFSTL